MPPEVKVSKERIVETAYRMSREKGFDKVTARKLAAELGCSTQPIFRSYKNMDMLKSDINEMANKTFGDILSKSFSSGNPLYSMAMNYVEFARTEKNLFKMMFMEESSEGNTFTDLFESEELDGILMRMKDLEGFSLVERRLLFMQNWIFAHGMASMVVTGDLKLDDKDLRDLMHATVEQLMR